MRTGPDSTASCAGLAPAGAGPTGAAPTGTGPTGTAPAGTAPTGTAPTGTAPAGTGSASTGPAAAAADGVPPGSTLSALDEGILAFERRRWRSHGAKDEAIRTTFGLAPASYYVRLSRLVESDEAMAYDPLLVQRLQRRVAGAGL